MEKDDTEIFNIAALLTSHNRKDLTITCLESLFRSKNASVRDFQLKVYITDDGSKDNTGQELEKRFPEINILYGNGNLFWAGGMRKSWRESLKQQNNAYLLINDDTNLFTNCFDELFAVHYFSKTKYGRGGIYIGSVKDPETNKFSYGGRKLLSNWSYLTAEVVPDGTIQSCELGNGNIMLVTDEAVNDIGILSERYIHGKADFDYTLRAVRKGIPVLVAATYCGLCIKNNEEIRLDALTLRERIQYLRNPKGIDIRGYMYFMKNFFPYRAPFVFISLWAKTLIPSFERLINVARKYIHHNRKRI